MHDLLIRNGTVVDGTGRPPFEADVAIQGDRIGEIGNLGAGHSAWRTIDASGRIVTPGFIDPHTHLDAQLFWDPLASPRCWHGTTTVVVGNCSVTFAPVRHGDEERLARTLESVEEIPVESILAGVPFGWSTYGGYLDSLAARPLGVNVAGLVGHAALAMEIPEFVYDFPAGAGRWIQGARGYDFTVVNGEIAIEAGRHTGRLNGRVVRA